MSLALPGSRADYNDIRPSRTLAGSRFGRTRGLGFSIGVKSPSHEESGQSNSGVWSFWVRDRGRMRRQAETGQILGGAPKKSAFPPRISSNAASGAFHAGDPSTVLQVYLQLGLLVGQMLIK